MGFMKQWDMADVMHQVHRCYSQTVDIRNDGFVAWECKRELLELKYELDYMLENVPSFGEVEKSFHEDQAKKKIVRILKS